jgi:hypothetical protein
VSSDGGKGKILSVTLDVLTKCRAGYSSLIRTYVQFILAKLRFHRLRPEFNGLFEYEEYISLKGIDDPNEGYDLVSNLHSGPDVAAFQL